MQWRHLLHECHLFSQNRVWKTYLSAVAGRRPIQRHLLMPRMSSLYFCMQRGKVCICAVPGRWCVILIRNSEMARCHRSTGRLVFDHVKDRSQRVVIDGTIRVVLSSLSSLWYLSIKFLMPYSRKPAPSRILMIPSYRGGGLWSCFTLVVPCVAWSNGKFWSHCWVLLTRILTE